MQIPWSSAIQQVRTGSVLAPLLALSIITGMIALVATAGVGDTFIARCLWALFALVVLTTIGSYIAWSFAAPDRLQTEDYRLERHRIDVIGDERNPKRMQVIDTVAVATSNTMQDSAGTSRRLAGPR
jgi:membrane protein implicated in regulation of membrane protease activity